MTISEEEELFGEIGNFADYWLGIPSMNAREGTWVSAETFLTAMRREEEFEPNRDSIESLMGSDGERGGGLSGSTPELRAIRAGIIAIGQASLDDAARRARSADRRSRT